MVSFFPRPCPQLPDFQQLLVKGIFHASAPIHLLLSYTGENTNSRAVLLTPRRESLRDALVELNDQWISKKSGIGSNSAAAQRTEIFYPPTLAHMKLLLSMLHEYDDTVHHAKTTLDTAPSLLVLHDISAYFIAQASEATVSAYMSVISAALALTASWSPRSETVSRLAVFDSGLAALKLPILRALTFDDSEEGDASRHRGTLTALLERYFEWVAEFPEDPDRGSENNEMQIEDEQPATSEMPENNTQSLKLRRIVVQDGGGVASGADEPEREILWRWSETVQVDNNGEEQIVFVWT